MCLLKAENLCLFGVMFDVCLYVLAPGETRRVGGVFREGV